MIHMNATNQAKQTGKDTIIAAIIGGICVIIAAIIGIFSFNINTTNKDLEAEIKELSQQNNDWESTYNELKKQFDDLHSENSILSEEIDTLKNMIAEDAYTPVAENNSLLYEENRSLSVENESLKEEIVQLQKEVENAKVDLTIQQDNTLVEPEGASEETEKIVSIFNLDTIKGTPYWRNHSYYTDKDIFTDTYGNEYLTAYIGHHTGSDINSSVTPTYLLDNKYSLCRGEIAWSKKDKNSTATAWIEFYSGDQLIYITEKITVDSRPFSFSFSVEGVEKLTIVRNATNSNTVNSWIIYPYLELVE